MLRRFVALGIGFVVASSLATITPDRQRRWLPPLPPEILSSPMTGA